MVTPADRAEPRLVDALALGTQTLEEVVVRGTRDTHLAISRRVHGVLRAPTRGASDLPGTAHHAIASAVYCGIGLGLRSATRGLQAAAELGLGPVLETGPRSRMVRSAVNGLLGDRIAEERPRLAIPMAPRVAGTDVAMTRDGLAAAYPDATGTVAVLVHGLCESELSWEVGRQRFGTTYADTLAAAGATPVVLRANTGLSLHTNGLALAVLLDRLVHDWPVPVERLVLVGHSMGGLIIRAASGLADDTTDDEVVEARMPDSWLPLVSDVITLGTPHLGAVMAERVGRLADGTRRLAEASTVGRLLDRRSLGVRDLVEGLGAQVPHLPHARYRLVAATVGRSERHVAGRVFGDLLVHLPSAHGRHRTVTLFPDAELVHVTGAHHFDLLNHPDVHDLLRGWVGAH